MLFEEKLFWIYHGVNFQCSGGKVDCKSFHFVIKKILFLLFFNVKLSKLRRDATWILICISSLKRLSLSRPFNSFFIFQFLHLNGFLCLWKNVERFPRRHVNHFLALKILFHFRLIVKFFFVGYLGLIFGN